MSESWFIDGKFSFQTFYANARALLTSSRSQMPFILINHTTSLALFAVNFLWLDILLQAFKSFLAGL